VCLCVTVSLVSSCADLAETGKTYQIDITPQMELQAARLNSNAPKVYWQTIMPTPEVEEIRLGKTGTALVGFLDLDTRYPNSSSLVPYYGPYVLYDTKSGKELWRHERERNPELDYSLLLIEPYMVYVSKGAGKTHLVVINPDDGKKLWETSIDSTNVSVTTNARYGVIIINSADNTSKQINVLELATGKQLWSVAPPPGQTLFSTVENRMLVVSSNNTLYSLVDGKKLWSMKGPEQSGDPVTIVDHKGGYIVARKNGMISQISPAGKLNWRSSLAGVPELVTITEKLAIIAVNSTDGKKSRLHAISLKGGKKVWLHYLSSKLSSAMMSEGNQLIYTITDAIESVSINNGKQLFRTSLNTGGVYRLPDHISIFPDHIAVASESKAAGFAIKDGRELWQITLNGTDYLTMGEANRKLGGPLVGSTDNLIAKAFVSSTNNINMMITNSDRYIKQAQQNYNNVINQTRNTITSKTAAVRADASFQRSLAASHVRNTKMINRSFDTMMMSVNSAFAALEAAQVFEQNAKVGAAAAKKDRAYKSLLMSYKIHEAARQDDYYMRPFRSRSGNGLVIVNMRSGTWAEIPTGPSESILEEKIYMNICE